MSPRIHHNNLNLVLILTVLTLLILMSFIPLASSTGNDHSSKTVGQGGLIPVYPPRHPASTGMYVNPFTSYRMEPAPMGITDFGYSSSTGPYIYNSTMFVGSINMTGLYPYNSSLQQEKNVSSLQLNLNLNFSYGGNTYTYWVQNVAKISSGSGGSTHYFSFIDNVWNFSSSNAPLDSSSIIGNGSVATYSSGGKSYSYYYYYANNLPGNNVTLGKNLTVKVRADSVLNTSGVPEVILSYNDGSGWITYDNIYFPFAKGTTTDYGFVVNGYNRNGYGLFYDAEFILGGPAGGASTVLNSGTATMLLQYWNGHNLNNVPTSYNFGGDTGETVSNVISSAKGSFLNATESNAITPGSGSLSLTYPASSLGILNITLPFRDGTVELNNGTYEYSNYSLNVTLPAGNYNITVIPGGGKVLTGNLSLMGGKYYSLDSSYFERRYLVNITESGLPMGTSWYIEFKNGTTINSTKSVMTMSLMNGTYNLSVTSSGQYQYIDHNLNFSVDGSNLNESVYFNRTYAISFNENGLTGLEWFVNLSGALGNSLSGNITYHLVNGTYTYTIPSIQGYTSTPSHGSVTVSGNSSLIIVDFVPVLYMITFNESGVPNGSSWEVYVAGSWHYSNASSISVLLSNGTYNYTASGSDSTYTMKSGSSNFTVDGKNITINVTLDYTYNSGIYLFQKLISVALLVALVITGAVLIRRKR